jgi:hypothetical protein
LLRIAWELRARRQARGVDDATHPAAIMPGSTAGTTCTAVRPFMSSGDEKVVRVDPMRPNLAYAVLFDNGIAALTAFTYGYSGQVLFKMISTKSSRANEGS